MPSASNKQWRPNCCSNSAYSGKVKKACGSKNSAPGMGPAGSKNAPGFFCRRTIGRIMFCFRTECMKRGILSQVVIQIAAFGIQTVS